MALTPTARASAVASCAAVLAFPFAASAEYSWEFSGDAAHAEWYEPNSPTSYLEHESDHGSLGGTYHLDPVEDDGVPYALAPFLDPATRVSIMASRETGPRVNDARGERKPETRDDAVSGQYLLRQSRWYVGGRYSRGARDDDLTLASITARSVDRRGYAVVAGKYFGGGATRLELSLDRTKTELESAVRFCGLFPVCRDATLTIQSIEDEVRVEVMHVGRLGSGTYTVFGAAREFSERSSTSDYVYTDMQPPAPVPSESERPDVHYITIGATLFPTASFGLHVGYTRVNGRSDPSTRFRGQDRELEWGASWFFRRNVGLEFTLTSAESLLVNNFGASRFDNERTAVRLIGRF